LVRLKRPARDKHSSLLVNYNRKIFNNIGPRKLGRLGLLINMHQFLDREESSHGALKDDVSILPQCPTSFYLASRGSTVVEHLPHHPKVKARESY
jgi:hypothetical protein